jgi:UDP-hydrolysing UDP-N-acetyl-D-glucosamine 2-epimerase
MTACEAIDAHPKLKLTLVLAGTACAMTGEIQAQGFEVAHEVPILRGKYTHIAMAKTTGTGVHELASLFERIRPDVVVTVADRYETLATAVAASYLGIPLVHVQGGEVTGSIDNRVRNAITALADFHCTATRKACERVTAMRGPEGVFYTGCPSVDLCARVKVDNKVRPSSYAVVMLHPDTRDDYSVGKLTMTNIVWALERGFVRSYVVSPNIDAGASGILDVLHRLGKEHPLIQPIPPQRPLKFLELVANAGVLVGNSSMGIRECSYLGVPALNIGRRQEGRERAQNVTDILDGFSTEYLELQVKIALKAGRYPQSTLYGAGDAGWQIGEVIAQCV